MNNDPLIQQEQMNNDTPTGAVPELTLSFATAIGKAVNSVLDEKGTLSSKRNCTITGNVLRLQLNAVLLENLMRIINVENFVAQRSWKDFTLRSMWTVTKHQQKVTWIYTNAVHRQEALLYLISERKDLLFVSSVFAPTGTVAPSSKRHKHASQFEPFTEAPTMEQLQQIIQQRPQVLQCQSVQQIIIGLEDYRKRCRQILALYTAQPDIPTQHMIFAAAMVDYFFTGDWINFIHIRFDEIVSDCQQHFAAQMDTNLQIYQNKIVADNTHTDGGDVDTPVAFEEDDGDHGGTYVFDEDGGTERVCNKDEMPPSPKRIRLQDDVVELQKEIEEMRERIDKANEKVDDTKKLLAREREMHATAVLELNHALTREKETNATHAMAIRELVVESTAKSEARDNLLAELRTTKALEVDVRFKYKKLWDQHGAVRGELKSTKTEQERIAGELEAAKESNRQLATEKDLLRKEYTTAKAEQERISAELEAANESNRQLSTELKSLKWSKWQCDAKLKMATESNMSLEIELKTLERSNRQLDTKLSTSKELNWQLDTKLTTAMELNQQLTTELDAFKESNQQLEDTNQQITKELDSVKYSNEQLVNTEQQLTIELNAVRHSNEQLENTNQQITNDLHSVKELNQQLVTANQQITKELDSVKYSNEQLVNTEQIRAIELNSIRDCNKQLKSMNQQITKELDSVKESNQQLKNTFENARKDSDIKYAKLLRDFEKRQNELIVQKRRYSILEGTKRQRDLDLNDTTNKLTSLMQQTAAAQNTSVCELQALVQDQQHQLTRLHEHLARAHDTAISLLEKNQELLANNQEASFPNVTNQELLANNQEPSIKPAPEQECPVPPSPEVTFLKETGDGRRFTRSRLLPVKIKIEKPMDGAIRCPHPDCVREQLGMYVQDRKCNVIMCTNHKSSYFFCYHCKKEIHDGIYSNCDCPKRNTKSDRQKAQELRNKRAEEEPIVVDTPEKQSARYGSLC